MRSLKRARLAPVFGLCLSLASLTAAAHDVYTFVWVPKQSDVGGPESSDSAILAGVLQLVETTSYQVANGDTLDFIIRTNFLVSQRQYPNAYGIYYRRILDLNPDITTANALKPQTTLILPAGPKYGGAELGKEPISPRDLRAEFIRDSVKAYGLASASEDRIRDRATRTLKVFVSPANKASDETAFSAIVRRGLVGAIDFTKHPEARLQQMQALTLYAASDAKRNSLRQLTSLTPRDVLTGTIPVDTSVNVDCHNTCTTCASALQVPTGLKLGAARVLVEDTGAMAGLVPGGKILRQDSGGDGLDQSPESHGTFVYSEIAAPTSGENPVLRHGVLPAEDVYVTRVTKINGGVVQFWMNDVVQGWKAFERELRTSDKNHAKTAVINISAAASAADEAGNEAPSILQGDLLFVAAAGNNGNEKDPVYYTFGRLSGGGTPLLIVGALDAAGERAAYSNYEKTHVQLFVQGNCICGAPNQLSGTSMAAPLVSTAAAVLASQKPTWGALYVMWRLIATADRPAPLKNKVLGGVVNVSEALEKPIILLRTTDGTPHRATSLAFDANWTAKMKEAALDSADKPVLRLHLEDNLGTYVCFSAIQYVQTELARFCVSSTSNLTLTTDGQSTTHRADEVADVIMPMPDERDGSVRWPAVAVLQ